MYANLWIIEWHDRGRRDEAIDTATTAQDALATIRQFLENETAFDESANEDKPALEVLFEDMDPIRQLTEMDDRLELECEGGDFVVRRTMRCQEAESPRCLSQAAPALYDFAQLFLAYHDAQTSESVTIQTLEHAARAAVAKAMGEPPAPPMTPEMIRRLKEHYLEWTGGCTPNDENEIFTYIELAMESGPDPEEVRQILRNWMEESDEQHEIPSLPLIVEFNQNLRGFQ